MRLPENNTDWLSAYLQDIEIANNELIEKNFFADPRSVICDIYVLPSHNHQTFYGKVISEHGFYKIIYAKAIQTSIWFSDPIYMYRFDEAKRFENHPMKKGHIVCRAKLIEKSLINRLLFTLERISENQPDNLVEPYLDEIFTAIRLYEGGTVIREIMYTNAERLEFRDSADKSEAVEFLRSLFVSFEKIIGIGD